MGKQILPVPDPIRSYWLSEPHELSNLRSTLDLPGQCDVLVIGSGMAGITTTYHILEGGKSNSDVESLPLSSPCPSPSVVILGAR